MDWKEIIEYFDKTSLTKMKISKDGFHIELEKGQNAPVTFTKQIKEVIPQNEQCSAIKSYIKSPMVGIFYIARSPKDKPFVNVGDQVEKGDIVCVIESMKVMNEVKAEKDGAIVDILVSNQEAVEYGTKLFEIA